MNRNEKTVVACLAVLFLLTISSGYLYNNAQRQAKDIKACQSVGANWYYNGFNQVLCSPKKKQCDD